MKILQAATLSLLLALLACADRPSSAPPGDVRLLFDGAHAPDVLVETREVAWPPSLAGSRFLTGWLPDRAPDGRRILLPLKVPQSARLELVNVQRKKQTLVIDFVDAAGPPRGRARVYGGDRHVGLFQLADPLELPLPMETLPLGRVPLVLTFLDEVPGVLAAAVRSTAAAGDARVEGADLLQSGDSLVDLVRPVAGGEVLVGVFVPPASALPGQRFELSVEGEKGTAIGRFTWTSGFWSRRSQRIELPLGWRKGFARIRLRALGKGPAGRWKGLALRETPPAGQIAERGGDRPAPSSPPRLIVVYVMDALRADRVGAPGVSPTGDRLAREGMAFASHRSVAPNTLPSTKALFTGRAFVARGGWKLLPEDGPTLAELLRAAGYRTGLFSGNVHVGPAFGADRGFEHVAEEVTFGRSAEAERPFNDNAARVQAAALAWLRSLPAGARAFLYLHTIHPHNPYDPPEPYRSRFTAGIASAVEGDTATLHAVKHHRLAPTAADRARIKGLYTGSFAYNDAELGRFLAALAEWAPPTETLVALTSDHGEELFDHGGVLHGYTLYEEMLRIPLILWAPGRLRPAVVAAPTDTLDLHATLRDLIGSDISGVGGRSLLRPLRASPEPRLAAASSLKGGIYAARSERYKLIWAPRTGLAWGMGEGLGRSRDPEYVFDLLRDPRETQNLAGTEIFEVAWLRSRLRAWVESERAAGEAPAETPVDRETRRRLEALGY